MIQGMVRGMIRGMIREEMADSGVNLDAAILNAGMPEGTVLARGNAAA
ncbi:MAG: hypothetical protein WDN25_00395 [Acetobacteraceae bacterium]